MKRKIVRNICLSLLVVIIASLVMIAILTLKKENQTQNFAQNGAEEAKIENVVETNGEENKNEKDQENKTENNVANEVEENKAENSTKGNTIDNKTTEKEENNKSATNENKTVKKESLSACYTKAEKLLKKMTIEEKVGQMFLVRYPSSGVINQIKNHHPGGYILFSRDFDNKTKSQMIKELKQNQSASKINLILGVDEEGGKVVRVSNHKAFRSSKFLSPQELWKKGKLQAILKDSKEKSALLKSIGLNMNLAPVVDVPKNSSSFIYPRSYGRDAKETATYAAEVVKTMNASNMISVLKHFPGYGDNVDTHTGIAVDTRDYKTFQNRDFLPFKKGIGAGAPCILVSHNIVNCMDKEKPASLSKNVHQILRKDLNFSGLIITDDLAMDAVKGYVENGEAAVQAVLAGNDMIISSSFVKQKNEILAAVKKGKIKEGTINQAVKRILAYKYRYGII